MSIFGGAKRVLEQEALEAAIKHLGKDGEAGIGTIGYLYYDYETNTVSNKINNDVMDRIRAEWIRNHRVK